MDTVLIIGQEYNVLGSVAFTLDEVAGEVASFVDASFHLAFLVEVVDADQDCTTARVSVLGMCDGCVGAIGDVVALGTI